MFARTGHDARRTDAYTWAMRLYEQGLFEQAAADLAPLCGPDTLGRLARFYGAMSRRAMGLKALDQGRLDVAQRHLRAAAGELGNRADLCAYLAAAYARDGKPQQCLSQCEQQPEQTPTGRCRLALAQWRAGRREPALMTLHAALRLWPDDASLHVQLALLHASCERYAQAREHLETAVRADPANATAHYNLGLLAAAQGRPAEAARHFQRALELQPADMSAAYHLALAARAADQSGARVALRPGLAESCGAAHNGDASPSCEALARYVAAEPEFAEAFLALPPSAIDAKLFGLLLAVVRAAIERHGAYADLQFHASRICRRLGRTGEALDHARQALAINPRYVQALVHMGGLLEELGSPREAMEHVRLAIAAGADWPDVHCMAGRLMASDMPQQARKHLERAIQLNPDYRPAAEALAALAA